MAAAVIVGNYRTGLAGTDLNRKWKSPDEGVLCGDFHSYVARKHQQPLASHAKIAACSALSTRYFCSRILWLLVWRYSRGPGLAACCKELSCAKAQLRCRPAPDHIPHEGHDGAHAGRARHRLVCRPSRPQRQKGESSGLCWHLNLMCRCASMRELLL